MSQLDKEISALLKADGLMPSSKIENEPTASIDSDSSNSTDKLSLLLEINNLIATNSNTERLLNSLSHAIAYRLSAQCAIAFLHCSDTGELTLKASYGIAEGDIPTCFSANNSQLDKPFQLGSLLSIPNLATQTNHPLFQMSELGFSCLHLGASHYKGERQALFVLGYQQPTVLTTEQSDLFQCFLDGAAVCLANASYRDQLSSYASDLQKLVDKRTEDLRVQTQLADEANKAKSRFVANISHELRSPLTAIIGYASVLSEEICGTLNKSQKEALTSLEKAGEYLKELLNDVLDVAKIEAGKEKPEATSVDVIATTEQVIKLMQQTALNKNICLAAPEYKRDSENLSPKAYIDRRHLKQILTNLISNAIKYTPQGGSVSVALEKVGDKIKISVKDTGIGIAVRHQKTLFQRFERVNESYSKNQIGTGIGLSLSKRLIELNGGKIGFESKLNEGSSFWILCPISTSEEISSDSKNSIEMNWMQNIRLDGLTILIVDDNASTRDVLKTVIQAVGGLPWTAQTVKEAIKIAEAETVDVALIDLALPEESGISVLDYFSKRKNLRYSNVVPIVVSACVFESDRLEAESHGAVEFIAKPFRLEDVVITIRRLTTQSVLKRR